MPIYQIQNKKLAAVREKKIDLERDVQRLTEENLETLFGLRFISGSLNQEFSIRVNEQDFYIDTLAYDEAQKSFVIIEYKKDRSFSVIDQGFAYLSAALNHKADLVLELREKTGIDIVKKDVDWEQTRVMFVSPEFTNYQRNAINFKDLPIFLYEVRIYDNNLIEYDPIKPYRTTESISRFTKDKTIQHVAKEVKVYTEEDLVKPNWENTRELLHEFQEKLLQSKIETKVKYTKQYVAYISKHGRNYVEIVPQQAGLKIYYRFPANQVVSNLKIEDCSKVGHWPNGISFVNLTDAKNIPEAVNLSQQSFDYLHKDIYPDSKK